VNKKIYNVIDGGTFNEDLCDYPDYAHLVAKSVINNSRGSVGYVVQNKVSI